MSARVRTLIVAGSVPRFPRGVRFRFDATRQAWHILSPEQVTMPDEIAVEVLKRVDGARTVDAIAVDLAAQFAAPVDEIRADVVSLLQELADDATIEDAAVSPPPRR